MRTKTIWEEISGTDSNLKPISANSNTNEAQPKSQQKTQKSDSKEYINMEPHQITSDKDNGSNKATMTEEPPSSKTPASQQWFHLFYSCCECFQTISTSIDIQTESNHESFPTKF